MFHTLTAIKEDGGDKRLVHFELASKVDDVALLDSVYSLVWLIVLLP